MKPVKRALISIRRTHGKSMILFILIVTLGSLVAGAISIRNSVVNTTRNLRNNMLPIVTIGVNWEVVAPLLEIYGSITTPGYSVEMIQALGSLPQVTFYDAILEAGLFSFDSEGLPIIRELTSSLHATPLLFSQGINTLITGRYFNELEMTPSSGRSVALISSHFAQENGLTNGSIFEVDTMIPLFEPGIPEDDIIRVGIELEIIGIFEVVEHSHDDTRYRDLNRIFVPNWVVSYINNQSVLTRQYFCKYRNPETGICDNVSQNLDDETNVEYEAGIPFFILKDPLEIDAFIAAATPFIHERQMLETTSSRFDDISSAMVGLIDIADLILFGAVGGSVLILSLLITLFLYDRRHEIGIYLALGEKRKSIMWQLLFEVLIVSITGLAISLFVGSIISNTLSQEMLTNELIAIETQREREIRWSGRAPHFLENFGIPIQALSADEMMNAFDTSLDTRTVTLFFAVGIGTVGLATVIPLLYVVKLEPKKVLL